MANKFKALIGYCGMVAWTGHELHSNTKGLLMNLTIETLVMYGGMLAILVGSLVMEIAATIRRRKDDDRT